MTDHIDIDKIKTSLARFFLLILLAAGGALFSAPAYAETPLPSSYELKFLLDSDKVLDQEHRVKDTYRNMFSFGDAVYQENEVVYLETTDRDFYKAGWINRVRLKGAAEAATGERALERTCKKRYSVSGASLEAINETLDLARSQGLAPDQNADKVEADWGYGQIALSLTYESDDACPYDALTKYSREDLINTINAAMPAEEKNWGSDQWGTDSLKKAVLAGPLTFLRLKGGKWKSGTGETIKKIRIEIWPIPDRNSGRVNYLTELSFKFEAKNGESAEEAFEKVSALRKLLGDYLDGEGILLHKDFLKTTAILDSYLPSAPPAPAPADPTDGGSSPAPAPAPAASKYEAGKGRTRGTYTVIGKNTAEYTLSGVGALASSATVPDKIKIKNKTYRVTRIASRAFTGCSGLRTVTIGANVSRIKASAFSGCSKLKTLKIRTPKLTRKKIKNSLRGSGVRTIRLLKKARNKYRYYRKIFTKKITGAPKKLKVRKK